MSANGCQSALLIPTRRLRVLCGVANR
jgi:hypothetical protein